MARAILLCLAALLFCSTFAHTPARCNNIFDGIYHVVHKATHRVVGGYAGSDDVDLQLLVGATAYNTWMMSPAIRPGLFLIQMRCCIAGMLGFDRDTSGLVRGENNDSIYQQWFFDADGRIVNGGAFNYGMKVNRTGLGQFDLYVGYMGAASDDDIFEIVVKAQ